MIDKMLANGWVVVNLTNGNIIRECFTKAEALSELKGMRETNPQKAEEYFVDRASYWDGVGTWVSA